MVAFTLQNECLYITNIDVQSTLLTVQSYVNVQFDV